MSSAFRSLSAEEIEKLTSQGCSSTDWARVQVADPFHAEAVRAAHFSGDVRLGVFEKSVRFYGGVEKPAGIRNAAIHNCTIGDNVYINQVGS